MIDLPLLINMKQAAHLRAHKEPAGKYIVLPKKGNCEAINIRDKECESWRFNDLQSAINWLSHK